MHRRKKIRIRKSCDAAFAAQELMYRYEQHPSGSGFSFLIFFRWCFNNRNDRLEQLQKRFQSRFDLAIVAVSPIHAVSIQTQERNAGFFDLVF